MLLVLAVDVSVIVYVPDCAVVVGGTQEKKPVLFSAAEKLSAVGCTVTGWARRAEPGGGEVTGRGDQQRSSGKSM